ncbi:formylglycine-generating enzyme family protein [Flagellimonas hymeniacidonis]|uniref:Formylglycine-generating enzyme family protein n=1 Tax=Flagellimonas hymeniacidonis TaxID=2603628 RepID=A0A5C8V0U8_9FLAO|nr:formylglycine-generating enzyme family protein [Flagellimonas hymeniacidonis]TXN34946.1 formylglycine-generating enzyme family protein [Flagellimonas hymeniacidonis]
MIHKQNIVLVVLLIFTISVIAQKSDKYSQKLPATTLKIEMVAIPSGSFNMGSQDSEEGRDEDEGPQRKMDIEGFWMSSYEITWELYNLFLQRELDNVVFAEKGKEVEKKVDAVAGATIPYVDMSLGMGTGKNLPIGNVTQLGASKFCEWLSAITGVFYRLPTEAEWEYAARAGTAGAYSFDDDDSIEEYAWFSDNSGATYHEIGKKKPNPWGLYDMYGNVAEWTLDQYNANTYTESTSIYIQVEKEYPAVIRGGSYKDSPEMLRSASRAFSKPVWKQRDPQFPKSKWWHTDAPFVGFRIIRPYMTPNQKEQNSYWLGKE